MNKLSNIFVFTAGMLAGALVMGGYFKKKYEEISQSEIDSVKEMFRKYRENNTKESDVEKEEQDDSEYVGKVVGLGYTKESDSEKNSGKRPYIISPDELGMKDGYETVSLTYYADKILVDDNDDAIHNPEYIVGVDWWKHFGEYGIYEDDCVYVRNDELKCDYEILRDERRFSDVEKIKPPKCG